jgi:hydrophobic/amphiphilic exporter-1 (mainly G- bacteria), HAE1 family
MTLSNISIKRPVATSMAFLGILGFGTAAFVHLSIDFLPAIQIPELTIKTLFPNSSPEEVEQYVTNPIESLLATVPGAKASSSVSREGVSIVTVKFNWGTNMDYMLPAVREKLDQLRGRLPEGAGRPMILRILPEAEPIIAIVVSTGSLASGGSTEPALPVQSRPNDGLAALFRLKEIARGLVKKRIEQVDGVARASVIAGVEREIHVELDRLKLGALHMSAEQVGKALAGASGNLSGGMIRHGQFRYSLRILGDIHHAREIGEIVVLQTAAGRPVRIRDIASVTDAYTHRMGITRYNGSEVVAVEVQKDAGVNTVTVSRRVHRVLGELRQENPGLLIGIISDQAEFISASVNDVEGEIVLGAVLSFTALLVFLGQPRTILAVGLTIPLSVLATFAVMYVLGINLNIMSLAGLALGIGMLGDNALIVVENLTPRGSDRAPYDAEDTGRITVALTASTLTNVAVFLPILLVEGVWSEIFRDMAVTMTVSLIVSLVVAVTLVPLLLSRRSQLRRPDNALRYNRIGRIPERLNTWSRKSFDRYLEWALQHRAIVLLIVFGMVSLSVGLAFSITSSDIPGIDRRRFAVTVRMPGSTTLETMMQSAAVVEKRIGSLQGVKGVYSRIGINEDSEYRHLPDAAVARGYIEVESCNETEAGKVMRRAGPLLQEIRSQCPGLEYSLTTHATTFEQILRPHHDDIAIGVCGEDQRIRDSIAAEWVHLMGKVEGIADIRSTLGSGLPEYRMTVDREKAWRFGLSVRKIADFITARLRGTHVALMNEIESRVNILLASENDIMTLQRLLSSSIPSATTMIPLRTLVDCRQTTGLEEITHDHQQRVRVLTASVRGRSVGAAAEDLKCKAASFFLPDGYSISIGGRAGDIAESVRGLLLVAALSVLLIYMILAAEYESLLSPFVILLTGPLAFTGAILAMAITGQEYNVMSLVGLVVMIGAVDNDAVIAIDVITALRNRGRTAVDAIRLGMRERLRPILLTTATTILGILPLMWEGWTGTDMIRVLTIPLVGGLIASTVFTLAVVPVVYSWIDAAAIMKK